MKKFLTVIICILLAFSIYSGCAKDNNLQKSSSQSSELEASETSDIETEVITDYPTDDLVDMVISAGEDWPKMAKVEDNSFAQEYFKLDLENPNYQEISIWQCPMSAAIAEVIIIKAEDGKTEEVEADLKERRSKLIDVDTFYPDHKNIAENSVIGIKGNYVYFIAAENVEEGENALLKALE